MKSKTTKKATKKVAKKTTKATQEAEATIPNPEQIQVDPVKVINQYIGQCIAGVASNVLGTLNELASQEGVNAAVKGLNYEQILTLIGKLNSELDQREAARKK